MSLVPIIVSICYVPPMFVSEIASFIAQAMGGLL